jgi:hypothetical protein
MFLNYHAIKKNHGKKMKKLMWESYIDFIFKDIKVI